MDKGAKIYIVGHQSTLGSAIHRKLEKEGYKNLLIDTFSSLNLTEIVDVDYFIKREAPDYIFVNIDKSTIYKGSVALGGDFLHDSLLSYNNIIRSAYRHGITKMSLIISNEKGPMPTQVLSGDGTTFNDIFIQRKATLIAATSAISLCRWYREKYNCDYTTVLIPGVYGYGDEYRREPQLIPSLLQVIHEARQADSPQLTIEDSKWLFPEFLFADDIAAACFNIMIHNDRKSIIDLRSPNLLSVKDIVQLAKDVVGYSGEIVFVPADYDQYVEKAENLFFHSERILMETPMRKGLLLAYQDFLAVHYPEIFFGYIDCNTHFNQYI